LPAKKVGRKSAETPAVPAEIVEKKSIIAGEKKGEAGGTALFEREEKKKKESPFLLRPEEEG